LICPANREAPADQTHPWHGLEIGPNPPELVTAFIEITPFDLVKYELDKATGYIRVDRPQRTSSQPRTLYGIIPRTYCGLDPIVSNPSSHIRFFRAFGKVSLSGRIRANCLMPEILRVRCFLYRMIVRH
jgi:Inorganic pyrophosphatase